MDTQTPVLVIPLAAAFLGFGLAWLVFRPDRLRASLVEREKELGQQRQDLATLQARFAARGEELEFERSAARQRVESLTAERDESRKKCAELQAASAGVQAELAAALASLKQVPVLTQERDEARQDLEAERSRCAQLRTDYAALQVEAAEKLKAGDDKVTQLKTDFENLANRIFDEKTRTFAQTSKDSVEGVLKPIRDQLTEFKKTVEEVYEKEARDRTSLKTEIELLQRTSLRASTGAEALAKALKGDSKVRGAWGEISLERILEQSGLRKGHEYDAQISQKNEEGQILRPDFLVYLPENKVIVIDSKVSLVHYERYHAAETDEERQGHLRGHVTALRTHLNGLSAKNYQDNVGKRSLDLVLMFVPIEPAYMLALEADGALYADAFNKKVLLVSPTTLMGTLQIINNIWRYEYQNRHTLEIAARGGALYDQFVLVSDSLLEVGERLGQAQKAYDVTRGRLTEGKGNLIGQVEKLRVLGVKAKKKLDPSLLEDAALELESTTQPPQLPSAPDNEDQSPP